MRAARRSYHLPLALLLATVLALWAQLPRLADPYQVEEDFRNLYWVRLFQDGEHLANDAFLQGHTTMLNAGDWSLTYVTSSPLYGLLFQLTADLLDPVLFSKLLVFPLLLISIYYIFNIGEQIAGKGTALTLALALAVLNLASHSAISVTGGLQRSFSMPLLLGLIYYLMRRQFSRAAFFVFLSGVIYPPLFPVSALTYGLSLVKFEKEPRRINIDWRHVPALVLATGIVLIALSPALLNRAQSTQAAVASLAGEGEHKLLDPAYGRHGRAQLFHIFPVYGRGGLASGGMDALHMVFMGALSAALLLIRGRDATPLPTVMRHLFVASVIGFVLAWLAFLVTSSFPLYLPSRYTQASFSLLLLVFLILNGRQALEVAAAWIAQRRQQLTSPLIVVAVLGAGAAIFLPGSMGDGAPLGRSLAARLSLFLLCALLAFLLYLMRKRPQRLTAASSRVSKTSSTSAQGKWVILGGILLLLSPLYIEVVERDFYDPSPDERAVYSFLQSLPRETRVAGAPCLLDGVPLYARRSVLFSCDRVGSDEAMVLEALDAYYAESLAKVEAFCTEYDVDVLAVDTRLYDRSVIENHRFFFEPYSSILAPTIMQRSDFVLQERAENASLFSSGEFAVLPCIAEPASENSPQ